MLDKSNEALNDESIIELIAKSLDEPLSPAEQAQVNTATEKSLALRLVTEGLYEFDALLKRTGMAIPDEGFPARVLLRIEAYERSRTRKQWYFTLGAIFLGFAAAFLWLALNWTGVVSLGVGLVLSALVLVPLLFMVLLALLNNLGQGPLLVYAVGVMLLTLLWLRVSGGLQSPRVPHDGE